MWEAEAVVATARWESEPALTLIGAVRDGVARFAETHGMARDAREDVRSAVAEAVADAVVRLRRGATPGPVVVDAATDGAWLSVWVRDDDALGVDDDARLPLVARLAHRSERGADARGTHVLMEFAMAPERDRAGLRLVARRER